MQVIAEDGRFVIVGEAADGVTAQEMIQRLRPQIAVLDIDMPKQNGLALAEKLRVLVPSVALIILTTYKEESLFNRALKLFISPRTVDTHRNNICTKLHLHGSRGLLVFALEHKQELERLKRSLSD